MLKATLLKQIMGAVLGLSLASSGLAYAGVEGAPNPVQEVVNVASSNDDAVEAQDEGDDPPTSTAGTPDEAEDGKATGAEKRQAAQDYTDAVRDWTECVKTNAQAQGDDETRVEGEFDPREGCDERPNPHDFGLTDVPDQASDEGKQNSQEGRERGEDARSENQSSSTSSDENAPENPEENSDEGSDESSDGEDNKPDDTPAGPPEERPGR